VDWPSIDRLICEVYHIPPASVDQMTLSEISTLLDAKTRTGPRPHMSDGEIETYAKWWAKLTPRERLLARGKRG
jgi:hypothetical protein